MKKKLQKAANGLQKIQADQNATRSLLTGAVSAGAEAALPGVGGALIGGAQMLSGLTRNEDGLYKNKTAQTLDGLNPVTQLSRGANIIGGIASGKLFRDGLNFDVTGQDALRDAISQEKIKKTQATTWGTATADIASAAQGRQYKAGTRKVGTKAIEIEGGEPHFSAPINGKRVLKSFSPNGPSHEQGGIPVLAEKGDAIVTATANKGKAAVLAHQQGDHEKVEKIISTMPADKGNKAKKGVRKVAPLVSKQAGDAQVLATQQALNASGYNVTADGILGDHTKAALYDKAGMNSLLPSKGMGSKLPLPGKLTGNAPVTAIGSTPATVPTRLGAAATSLAQAAPTLYNMGQGLFGNVDKTTRRTYKPTAQVYEDTSAPQRAASTQGMRGSILSAANYSGGNVGNARANTTQAYAENLQNQSAISAQESNKKLTIGARNVEDANRAQLINNQMNDTADVYDMQNAAKKTEALSKGLEGMSGLASNSLLMKNQAAADGNSMDYLKQMYKNYTIGADGKIVLKAKKGIKKVK